MEGELVVNPQDLEGLTPNEILELLDSGWPWPLDAVQEWFEALWNAILSWLHQVVGWVYDRIKPAIDIVWSWINAGVSWLWGQISSAFTIVWGWLQSAVTSIVSGVQVALSSVYSWLQSAIASLWSQIQSTFSLVWSWVQTGVSWLWANIQSGLSYLWQGIQNIAATVAAKVAEINAWFSDNFIDPFIDWLVKFPENFSRVIWEPIKNAFLAAWNWLLRDDNWKKVLIGSAVAAAAAAVVVFAGPIAAALGAVFSALGGVIVSAASAIGSFFTGLLWYVGGWILSAGPAIGVFFRSLLPKVLGWLAGHWRGLLAPVAILGAEATGVMNRLVRQFVTPLFVRLFDWAEAMGPVSPTSGKSVIEPLSGMIEITIGGLATMTLAGETLGLWKHIGMGHISAMVYDLTNYKVLTAAFVGVLAGIYIRTPLTYYYNKIARPNIPSEGSLLRLAGEYAITREEFNEGMAYQGYDDEWIPKLWELADRPLTPRLFTQIASVGILDDELIDRELKNAGYNALTIPYLKTWLKRQAEGDLKTLMTSLPITRFKEGFDTEADLRQNLAALGVSDSVMPKYVFAAQLSYLFDYQSDLKAYYIDAYHRRELEEPELRGNLTSIGIKPERLDLIVAQQKIKRLAAPKAAEPAELTIQIDTIRDRRKKLLITRDEEVQALVALGKELGYALAIADNDDAALAEKAVISAPAPVPAYETEEGKIRVDTIRRLRRQRQISAEDELASLAELQVPQSLARAISDNDELRLRKETASE